MAKPYEHSISSAQRWGGTPDEYLKFHEWFDQTKAHIADVRHRAILHTSFGIYLFEQMFGEIYINSEGKSIHVRELGEQHILEDFKGKFIPTLQDYLCEMDIKPWMTDAVAGYPPSYRKVRDKVTTSNIFTNDPATVIRDKIIGHFAYEQLKTDEVEVEGKSNE